MTTKYRLLKLDLVKQTGEIIIKTNPTPDEVTESIYSIYLLRLCDILKDLDVSLKANDKINNKPQLDYLIEMFNNYSDASSTGSVKFMFSDFLNRLNLTTKGAFLSFAIKIEDSLLNKYCITLNIGGTPTQTEIDNVEKQVESIDGMIYDATNADIKYLLGPTKKDTFDKKKRMFYTRASLFDPHTSPQNMFLGEIVSMDDDFLKKVGLSSINKTTLESSIETGKTHTGKSSTDFNSFKFFGLDFMPTNPYTYSSGNSKKNDKITKSTNKKEIDMYLWAKELGDTLQSFFITQNQNKSGAIICLTNDRGFTFNCLLSEANFVFSEKSGSTKGGNKKYLNYYYIKEDTNASNYKALVKKDCQPYLDSMVRFKSTIDDFLKIKKPPIEIPLVNVPNIVLIVDKAVIVNLKLLSKCLKKIIDMMKDIMNQFDPDNKHTTITLKGQLTLIQRFFQLFSNNKKSFSYNGSDYELPTVLSTTILSGTNSEIDKYITEIQKYDRTEIDQIYGDKFCKFVMSYTTDKELSLIYGSNTYIKLFKKYFNKVTKRDVMKGGVAKTRRDITKNDSVLSELYFDVIYEKIFEKSYNLITNDFISIFKNSYKIELNEYLLKEVLTNTLKLPETLGKSVSNTDLLNEINEFNKIIIDSNLKKTKPKLKKYMLTIDDVADFDYDYVKYIKTIVFEDIDVSPDKIINEIKKFVNQIFKQYYSNKYSLYQFRFYKMIMEEFIANYDDIAVYPDEMPQQVDTEEILAELSELTKLEGNKSMTEISESFSTNTSPIVRQFEFNPLQDLDADLSAIMEGNNENINESPTSQQPKQPIKKSLSLSLSRTQKNNKTNEKTNENPVETNTGNKPKTGSRISLKLKLPLSELSQTNKRERIKRYHLSIQKANNPENKQRKKNELAKYLEELKMKKKKEMKEKLLEQKKLNNQRKRIEQKKINATKKLIKMHQKLLQRERYNFTRSTPLIEA